MADLDTSEQEPQTNTQPSGGSGGGAVSVNMAYLKSIPGILKLVEIFLLMVAFSCAADVCSGCSGNYTFFMFATIFPWLLCIIIFVLFFLSLVEKINVNIDWNLTLLGNSALWALVLLIAASLWADSINASRKYLDIFGISLAGGYYASVVFGFLAVIAFVVDAIFLFKASRG